MTQPIDVDLLKVLPGHRISHRVYLGDWLAANLADRRPGLASHSLGAAGLLECSLGLGGQLAGL